MEKQKESKHENGKQEIQEKKNELQKLEEEIARRMIDATKLESTPIKLWINEQGNQAIAVDPKFSGIDAFKHITGTKDMEIAKSIMDSCVDAIEPVIERGKGSLEKFTTGHNIVMQSLHDFRPKDAVEARLVSQAVALYQHGMDRLRRAGRSDQIPHSEAQTNMAIKLLRCHNETIETLSRYRRGGEQRVIVQHIADKMAVVNNFSGTGGGGSQENKGASPCSENAEHKPDPTKINHVDNPQWPMGGADCTEEKVRAHGQKRAENE